MDFGEMQELVSRRLGKVPGSSQFLTTADIKIRLNEGLECLSESTEWYELEYPFSMGLFYPSNIPESFSGPYFPLTVRKVHNPDTNAWLEPTMERDLDADRRDWQTVVGDAMRFMVRGFWKLQMYPVPNGITPRIWFTAIPADMSADSDVPGFPLEFHEALVHYAVADFLGDLKEWDLATLYWNKYLEGEGRLKKWSEDRLAERMYGFGSV